MSRMKCPGGDQRYWKPEDIFETGCPRCAGPVEFFRDDTVLPCPRCGEEVRNPRIFKGCAQWCARARECLGEQYEYYNGRTKHEEKDNNDR